MSEAHVAAIHWACLGRVQNMRRSTARTHACTAAASLSKVQSKKVLFHTFFLVKDIPLLLFVFLDHFHLGYLSQIVAFGKVDSKEVKHGKYQYCYNSTNGICDGYISRDLTFRMERPFMRYTFQNFHACHIEKVPSSTSSCQLPLSLPQDSSAALRQVKVNYSVLNLCRRSNHLH